MLEREETRRPNTHLRQGPGLVAQLPYAGHCRGASFDAGVRGPIAEMGNDEAGDAW